MMQPFLAAIRFLTICPLPASEPAEDQNLARSAPFFPLVGLCIGAAAAGLDDGLSRILPPLPVAVLMTVFLLSVSGGLHLDGLADTSDGFFSSRPRERMLEIMRDSRTGPMGVTAIVCVLMLKVTLLACVPHAARWWVFLLMPFAGRTALLMKMSILSYVRPEGGLAAVFQGHISPFYLLPAVFGLAFLGWVAGGWPGLTAGLASFGIVLLFAAYVKSKIGGYTGDTLGAACELTELVPPMVCVILLGGKCCNIF